MKKIIAALMLLALCFAGYAGNGVGKAVPKDKLLGLISEYRHSDGFDIVNVGALGTSLVRAAAKIAMKVDGDPEMVEAVKLLNDIRRVAVVDYEDCGQSVKNEFNSKLDRILAGSEVLMEVKDSEDLVRIYGVVNEDASRVKDFVIHVPNDCALICMFGSIPMDAVAKVMEMEMR